MRLLLALILSVIAIPAYAQQWDRVNGSMQVKSGPAAPLVIVDQTNTAANRLIASFRAAGTEKCSIDIDGDLVCVGTFTLTGQHFGTVGNCTTAPAYSFTGDANNGWSSASADTQCWVTAGTERLTLSTTALTSTVPFVLGTTTLSEESAAVLQLGVDAAGVTNQLFKGPDRITSDGVGGNLTLAGGRNRGASVGGSIFFQTSPTAGAGVAGTLVTAFTIDSVGSVTSPLPTAGIGYATGAGGVVTQLTSKSTGVTLNAVTGEITMNAALLLSLGIVSFTLTSTAVAANDYVMVQHVSAGTVGAYSVQAVAAAGSATITVANNSALNLSEAIVLKYVVFKAVIS